MTDRIEITPSRTKGSSGKAMMLAGAALMKTMPLPARLAIVAIQFASVVLAAMGGTVLGTALSMALFGYVDIWFVPLCGVVMGIAYAVGQRIIPRLLGQGSDRQAMNRNPNMYFDAEGLVYSGGSSVWRSGWEDVEAIAVSGGVVSIVVGGITFPALSTDFPPGALDRLQNWREAARG